MEKRTNPALAGRLIEARGSDEQKPFARKIGTAYRTLQRWEETGRVKADALEKYASIGVSVTYLLTGEGSIREDAPQWGRKGENMTIMEGGGRPKPTLPELVRAISDYLDEEIPKARVAKALAELLEPEKSVSGERASSAGEAN